MSGSAELQPSNADRNENLVHFPKRKELKDTANAESVFSFTKYKSHLELLSKEFQERFLDFSSFEEHCIILSTIHIWCCQGRGKPADRTTRNAVGFYTQSKVSWSWDTSFLFIPSWEVYKLQKVCNKDYGNIRFYIICVWTVIFLHEINKNLSENKADWWTLVISDRIRNCPRISARHTKNCHEKVASSLRTKCVINGTFKIS